VDYFDTWYQVNAAVLWPGAVVAIAILLGIVVFFWVRLRRLENRYNRLMSDSAGDSLQEMLEDHIRRVRGTLDRVDALERLAATRALPSPWRTRTATASSSAAYIATT